MNIKKKSILLIPTLFAILITPKTKKTLKEISINDNYVYASTIPYATYSNGNVYIINNEELLKITDSNDVYIIDQRDIEDPDMHIYNSCNIKKLKQMQEIITIIEDYEKKYPSSWDRSHTSMLNEWIIHNICYELGYNIDSSISVDLNNSDENKYLLTLCKKR